MEMSWQERAAVAVLVALVLVGVPVGLWRHGYFSPPVPEAQPAVSVPSSGPGEEPVDEAEDALPPEGIVVHVAGAVRQPGVYTLPSGARVVDAVRAAGGELPQAAVEFLNLAARLRDGEQVYVPTRREAEESVGGRGVLPDGSVPGSGTRRVDLNRASVEELNAVPGIGPALAERIVAYRRVNGPFARVEDLLGVPGIGPKNLEKMKERLAVR